MTAEEWQIAASVVAAVVALIALGVAATAAGYTRGQRDASERQADAAEAQVEVMRRQLVVMESQGSGHRAHEVPYVPPWSLSHVRGDMYSLTNGGTEVAFDVQVTPPPHSAMRGTLEQAEVGPRSSMSFMAALTLASPHSMVKVTWSRSPGGPTLEWETILPAKS